MNRIVCFTNLGEIDELISEETRKTFSVLSKNKSIKWGILIDGELFNKYGEPKTKVPVFLEDLFSLFYESAINYRGRSIDGKTLIVVFNE